MGLSHDTVVKRYAERKTGVSWSGHNIFGENKFLFSYGYHFPLASYLGEWEGRHLFLKNGDKYSDSTSHHQSITSSHCPGPTVTRSGLSAFGINFKDVQFEHFLFWQEAFYKYVHKCGDSYFDDENAPWIPPDVGGFRQSCTLMGVEHGCWSVSGVLVLQWKGKFYLCSLEEGRQHQYHKVWCLPRRPVSIPDAFDSLKPDSVLEAEKQGLKVKKIGKWFFIPTGLKDKEMAKKTGKTLKGLKGCTATFPLPGKENGEYQYVAGRYLNHDDIFVRGLMTYRFSGGVISDSYKSVRLGDEWHLAQESQAIEKGESDGTE